MVPASAWVAPEATPIRVDLPAPFSPRRAWISPGKTSSDTSVSADTLAYRLADAAHDESRMTHVDLRVVDRLSWPFNATDRYRLWTAAAGPARQRAGPHHGGYFWSFAWSAPGI